MTPSITFLKLLILAVAGFTVGNSAAAVYSLRERNATMRRLVQQVDGLRNEHRAIFESIGESADRIVLSASAADDPDETTSQAATNTSQAATKISTQVFAVNLTKTTTCAEDDNVNVSLTSNGSVSSYTIEATHPSYSVGADSCAANFSQCPMSSVPSFAFTASTSKLFDDGETVVVAIREATWWRPQGMKVSANSGAIFLDAHYVTVSRIIPGTHEYPQFFVFYADGNMRLIPFPPVGKSSVCFSSSVIIGPIAPGARPYSEITSVNYTSASKTLQIVYASGGSAEFSLSEVTRTSAKVRVNAHYVNASRPFLVFRSTHVSDGNTNVDHVRWRTPLSTSQESPILSFAGNSSLDWFFYRTKRSEHNTSAPDIRITISQ